MFTVRKYKPEGFIEHVALKNAIICYIGLDDLRQEENLLGNSISDKST